MKQFSLQISCFISIFNGVRKMCLIKKILRMKKKEKMMNFGSLYFKVAGTDFPNSFSGIITVFA